MSSSDKEYEVRFRTTNTYNRDVTFNGVGNQQDGSSDLTTVLTKTYPVKMHYDDPSNLKVNFKNTIMTYFNKTIPISSVEGLQEILDEKADITSLALVAFTGMWDDLGFRLPQIIDCGTATEVIDVSG